MLPKKAKVDVEVISPDRANIYIPDQYVPKIIGKNGKIAKAIRTVMKAAAATDGKRVNVEIR